MKITSLATAASLAVSLAAATEAQELKYANWAPPFHTITEAQIDPLASALAEGAAEGASLRAFHSPAGW